MGLSWGLGQVVNDSQMCSWCGKGRILYYVNPGPKYHLHTDFIGLPGESNRAHGSRKLHRDHSCVHWQVVFVCVWVCSYSLCVDSHGLSVYVSVCWNEYMWTFLPGSLNQHGFRSSQTSRPRNRAMISPFPSIWDLIQQHSSATYCINYMDPENYSVTHNTCLPFAWLDV